jgi:hypothetical protein
VALKICPACQKQVGPRTKKCDCGHEFAATTTAAPASGQSMSLDPLDKRIAESVGNVRDIISRVENRPASAVALNDVDQSRRTTIVQQPIRPQRSNSGGGKIIAPAGECPVKPRGYKDKWPDGPASDEVVQTWATDVYNHGEGRYAIGAVLYFARYFWDINGQEYRRIRELIVNALQPSRSSDHEFSDEIA